MLQSAQQKIGVFLFRNFAQIFTMSYLSQNSRRGSTLDIPEDAMRNYVALWTKAVNRVIIAKKLTKARWVTNTMSCPRTSAFPFTLTTCIIKTQVSKYLLIWYRNEQRAVQGDRCQYEWVTFLYVDAYFPIQLCLLWRSAVWQPERRTEQSLSLQICVCTS